MGILKEMSQLRTNLAMARKSYLDAIARNLKDSGKEFWIEPTGDDEGCRVNNTFDDEVVNMVIDKIRWHNNQIELHKIEEDSNERDEWFSTAYVSDDALEYIYDSIIWED